ncbi:MAG: outer membrane protein OmpA-like peptidoglycan-associated protein [Saprospiraceae bacterium]|jgi:outer membrane protein OmpA-like peptidoglycan-associated protein
MKRLLTTTTFIFLLISSVCAQKNTVTAEGYVFAEDNSGYLKGAIVTLLSAERTFRGEVITDDLGKFEFMVKDNKSYKLRIRKAGFMNAEIDFSGADKNEHHNLYLNVSLERAPGYIFEATIADWRSENSMSPVDAIEGATIEVYNKTERQVILELKNHPYHTFSFRMEQGNSYVILIRKKEYFNKRIDANISIDGCILCIEGVGITRPGIADNLTDNNRAGTLGANISLKKILMDESIKIDNIYYDLGKYNIRQDAKYELDKLVSILSDNPHISIELSAHTDSRGDAATNLSLSQKRAETAAKYMISQGIWESRIQAKGYGERTLVNNCKDGIKCSKTNHQENRRTEFKVISITADETKKLTLAQMMEKELFEEGLEELMFQEVVYVAGEAGEKMVYESYEGNPKKVGSPKKEKKAGDKKLWSETKEYVDHQLTEEEKPKLRVEYTIRNDPFKNSKSTVKPKKKSKIPVHKTKKVSQTYTGYKIELIVSEEMLLVNHRLFREMGGVEVDVTSEQKYAYLIGNFSNEKSAKHFFNNVIKDRFPNTKIQRYENGKQVK